MSNDLGYVSTFKSCLAQPPKNNNKKIWNTRLTNLRQLLEIKQVLAQFLLNSIEVCTLPKDSGPCEAAITNWFYNPDTMKCESFIYGGCKGNKNNFETKQKCQNLCDGVGK